MTGPILLDYGSVGAPGLAFDGDPDTGIWSAGADVMQFVTTGIRRMQIGTGAVNFGNNTTGDGRIPDQGHRVLS